jgi:S-adenosylmethionine:tRNA ribosyltransferase-isomerase
MNTKTDPRSISVHDFTYVLHEDRIAKFPLQQRDASRLLVFRNGEIRDTHFRNLPELLHRGDLMVFNETKVIHARLVFTKDSGAVIEILCLEPTDHPDPAVALRMKGACTWAVMIGNLKRWKEGPMRMELEIAGEAVQLQANQSRTDSGNLNVIFRWNSDHTFSEILEAAGRLPIPPYLHREAEDSDEASYQTVYAHHEGSVAAPTAGLHFTEQTLSDLDRIGIKRHFITLHVGAGTFLPVKSDTMAGHNMHEERIFVDRSVISGLLEELKGSREQRIIAVGTTTLRTLESIYWAGALLRKGVSGEFCINQWIPYSTQTFPSAAESLQGILDHLDSNNQTVFTLTTKLLIAPGYQFKIADVLVTNFHQPNSTLLLLVAAFIGEDWRKVYNHALDHGYRFLSYGDSSLLFRADQ